MTAASPIESAESAASASGTATTATAGFPALAFGYGTNGFSDHPLLDALDVLQEYGYEAVALTIGHPHLDVFANGWRERTEALADELQRRGLRVLVETGARYVLDRFVKHRPTLVDREAEARMKFLFRAVDVAAILSAECVSLWSGVLPADVPAEEGWSLMRSRLQEVLGYAARANVRIAIEPEPGMLVETVADALRMRTELGNPEHLGITVDIGHCVAVEPEGVEGALRAAGPLLMNIQVDDMMPGVHEHLELGTGQLDLALALRTLQQLDYRGIAAIELPRHSHDAPRLARTSLEKLRMTMNDLSQDDSANGQRATQQDDPWTTTAVEAITSDPKSVVKHFAMAGRAVGRTSENAAPYAPDAADNARSSLLAALVHAPSLSKEEAAATVLDLYRRGDDGERRGVLRGLNRLASGEVSEQLVDAGLEVVKDALRTNDPRIVSAAMGAFAARHLDQHAWRHGVLKLVFMGVPIATAEGLNERSDDELVRMARNLAAERNAAGRTIPDDLTQLMTASGSDSAGSTASPSASPASSTDSATSAPRS
jgi:sugar phosphate isomerase/epimerase